MTLRCIPVMIIAIYTANIVQSSGPVVAEPSAVQVAVLADAINTESDVDHNVNQNNESDVDQLHAGYQLSTMPV